MKKLLLAATLISIAIILTACADSTVPNNNNSDFTTMPILTITEEGSLSTQECEDRGLTNKVVMIESKYCSHCQEAKPVFEEACNEAGSNCEILDIAEKDQRTKMISYSVDVKYTPTFIINCNYYVGGMEKSEYISLIQG